MLKTLQLKDLFVGKTDAKNELNENTEEERNRFIDSFLLPENINIDDFINGKRYFITGLKGTGKTALLRYLALEVERGLNSKTSFILFKTEFTDEDKTAFARAANAFMTLKNEISEADFDEDYVNVWQWFIHRHIVRVAKQNEGIFFERNHDWEKYSKCVSAPKLGNEESGITRLLPKLKKGNVEIEGDIEFLKGKLGFEFEWENEASKLVKFSSIVRQANELFKKLTPSSQRLYIILDELELTLGKIKQYQKDVRLIRDLIVAINNVNTLSRQFSFPIFLITAIRSEVLTSVESAGKEINKPILDFGINLKWQQSGGNIKSHPLIKIINRKIQAAEKSLGWEIISDDEGIWQKYFPSHINNKIAQEYILHRTWYRPRDIVRILNIAQQQFPNETTFSHQVFDAITKEYSTQSWVEHAEELRTTYTEKEIDGIKKLLTSLTCPFNMAEFIKHCDQKRSVYSDVDSLLEQHKPGDILSLLYRVGLIGNTGQNVRYSFRGDDELVIENSMKVHDPLWNYLSIQSRSNF